jgi:beta-lactamase class A
LFNLFSGRQQLIYSALSVPQIKIRPDEWNKEGVADSCLIDFDGVAEARPSVGGTNNLVYGISVGSNRARRGEGSIPMNARTEMHTRFSPSCLIGLFIIFLCRNGFAGDTPSTDLQKRFETIARTADGKVGATVELLETKEAILLNSQEHFPMQSVYKLPIAMAVLRRVENGTLKLDQLVQVTTNDFISEMQHSPLRDANPHGAELSVSNLLWLMVSESDGTACDVLLRLLNGPSTVDRYLRELGVTNVIVATTEKEMGQNELTQYRNWATPEGMVGLLRILHEGRGLSASSRNLLLKFLTETSTGPGRIKGLLPSGTPVAHKTGSSRTVNGLTAATNDAGIVTLPNGRHLAIVVLVSDSKADDATREAVIAKISRAAWDYYVEEMR